MRQGRCLRIEERRRRLFLVEWRQPGFRRHGAVLHPDELRRRLRWSGGRCAARIGWTVFVKSDFTFATDHFVDRLIDLGIAHRRLHGMSGEGREEFARRFDDCIRR